MPGWAKGRWPNLLRRTWCRGPARVPEDLGGNVALVQRRIANPAFKTKFLTVGTQSNTKVAVLYVDSVASPALVEEVLDRIRKLTSMQ